MSPRFEFPRPLPSRRADWRASTAVALASVLALALSGMAAPALAAQSSAPAATTADGTPAARMVVEAKELVYDEKQDTVTARGAVQIYYKGRLLEADRVTYNRKTNRVFAEGHAKLTERDGSVMHAERLDLTDDLKNGFIDSLRADSKDDDVHFSAPRAERAGDTTVFDRGTYTACDACKDDPTKPRLWQIRAKRIIHDNVEKMLYYEDATFEFAGVPIAYVPFMSSADPTRKRESGILSPQISYRSQLGAGIGVPIYWAMAPDYDLTITPTYFTRQGPFLSGEFRQRLLNGSYSVRAEGAHVGDTSAFSIAPYGAGDKRWRGSVQSSGEFALNDRWKFGWDGTLLSDRYFLQDYKQYNSLLQNYYFRETSSTVYLVGQGPRSFFDLRSYYFQGLSASDVQGQQPIAHPVLDYNRAIDIDPKKTFGVGGELGIDANVTSVSEEIANYESIQPRTLDRAWGLYNVCENYAPATNRTQSGCLLRGVGGNYNQATLNASWKRRVIDPVGGVWTPFLFARATGSYLHYDPYGLYPYFNNAGSPLPNGGQYFFINRPNDSTHAQVTPGAGVEWRYPILASGGIGSILFEPIIQLVARPNQSSIPSHLNLDSQSLVFDDSTLFEWSKYSGYDRFESGTRLNYGGQASLVLPNGGFVNALVGQSRQVSGRNGYATPDAANVGLDSGLETRTSDLVGRLSVAPASFLSVTAKGRFDDNNLRARRVDLVASLKLDPFTIETQYANYQSQPMIGFNLRRQGMTASGRYDITKNYYVSGDVTFDMSRYLYNALTNLPTTTTYTGTVLRGTAPVFSIATMGFSAGYHDECTSLSVRYSSIYQPQASTGLPARNQTIMVSLQLRTLGEARFNFGLGSTLVNDGVKSSTQ